jgi:hypothetical protein
MTASVGSVITGLRERASALVVGVSLAVVASATGFISYTHISALTIILHGSWKTAHLMPLAVDGQIAIGSVILMEVKDNRRWLGLIGFAPGLLESLFANWESGIVHGLLAAGWSTVPAQAFACSTFLFEMWLRYRRSQAKGTVLRRPRQLAYPVAARTSGAVATLLAQLPELSLQAPEPAAPGPEPQVTACRDLSRALGIGPAPAGAPWGLVSLAGLPRPEPAPAVSRFPLPVPVMGPVQSRPRAVPSAPAAARLPLPEDPAELREAVASLSQNEIAKKYEVSRYKAGQLKSRLASGTLGAEEEAGEDVA